MVIEVVCEGRVSMLVTVKYGFKVYRPADHVKQHCMQASDCHRHVDPADLTYLAGDIQPFVQIVLCSFSLGISCKSSYRLFMM